MTAECVKMAFRQFSYMVKSQGQMKRIIHGHLRSDKLHFCAEFQLQTFKKFLSNHLEKNSVIAHPLQSTQLAHLMSREPHLVLRNTPAPGY